MRSEQVFARSAIEALRSGVPSRHSAEHLGTTQHHVREAFESRLNALRDGSGVEPLVIAASFGAGKSHLLNYLKALATRRGCVSSFVVVSPEMPLGNPHLVLKSVAESAEAPERAGSALRSLASDLKTNSTAFAQLRLWSRDAGLDERFPAMLQIYEELRADEEFRTQILSDFEGNPLMISLLRQKLKEIGQSAAYSLKAARNASLAHDRIRLLARFYRACGCKGWVMLFDELERFALFPTKQRLAAWQELGWWQQVAQEEGASILPVFAVAAGLSQHAMDVDEPRFMSHSAGAGSDERDAQGLAGIIMVRNPERLSSLDAEQEQQIKYRVKAIYEEAYGEVAPEHHQFNQDVHTSIRSEIRRWITAWDLNRCYPGLGISMVSEEIQHDTSELNEEALADDDSEFSV